MAYLPEFLLSHKFLREIIREGLFPPIRLHRPIRAGILAIMFLSGLCKCSGRLFQKNEILGRTPLL